MALAIGLVMVGGSVALGACSVPLPSASACGYPSEKMISAVESRLTASGTLRNGRTVGPTKAGWTMVSAELHQKGDKTSVRGDILTFALPTGATDNSTDFFAVDTKARSDSTWPKAPFSVTAPGVITSRGCVLSVLGTVPCTSQGGALPGAPIKTNCDSTTEATAN